MARRQRMTLGDYVAIGITPALIMFMIGALSCYLVSCVYAGEFAGRLKFICAMYAMGVVATSRIAIEEGSEHALLFGGPLALVTFIAAQRFVQAGMLINGVLVAAIWWSAHKLTWDCTVIDDAEGGAGEGVLQAAGFDTSSMEGQGDTIGADQDFVATTAEADPQEDPKIRKPFWVRWAERQRHSHTPGATVVYFLLAAVPLLALGNMARASDQPGVGFLELVVFVASALALLSTTSFLNLRRYLRQRRLQMPVEMTRVWLVACTPADRSYATCLPRLATPAAVGLENRPSLRHADTEAGSVVGWQRRCSTARPARTSQWRQRAIR